MIKNIKLMLVAAMAMLSMNSFAGMSLTAGAEQTIGGIKYTVLSVYNTETATNVNTVSAEQNNFTGTEIVIPETVDIAVEGTDSESKAIKKTATFKVVEIKADGFKGLSNVTSVKIGANVAKIGAGAFAGTSITSLDLSGTQVVDIEKLFVSATAPAVNSNNKLTTVSLPATVNKIKADAFKDCSALTTVTFAAFVKDAKNVNLIAAGAFEGTGIVTLDLTNTKITTLNNLFTNTDGSNNKKLTTVKLPLKLETVGANAFKNCKVLTTVTFAEGTDAANLTIKGNAFNGVLFMESLTLPANLVALSENALAGSSIETLTINSNATDGKPTIDGIGGNKLTSIVVKGDFKGVFGDETNAVSTTITSLTFEGKIIAAKAIKANAFVSADKLATVNFNGAITAEGAIDAGAFGNGTNCAGENVEGRLVVNYHPANDSKNEVKAFNVTAFQTETNKDTKVAKLVTETWYRTWMLGTSGYNTDGIYGVNIVAAAVTKNLVVANNGQGNYYYATFNAKGNYKIAAAQNGGKVMVYGAYIDQIKNADKSVTNQVYMDQLMIIGGYYYIKNGNTVVVKSTTADDVTVVADEDNLYDSNHYDTSSNDLNQISATSEEMFGKELKDLPANSGKDVYFLAPFEDYGFLWSKFSDKRVLPEGTFYLTVDKAAASRVVVVWSDGSEETTAIKGIENNTVINNGAIYNLAGQQVDANYKGVVIKNGKKMIQK